MMHALLGTVLAFTPPADPFPYLNQCSVVWTTPSKNASGSMPLGNGVVGANAWVEENGDLCFYISRVDSWSECERLLKIGKIRITLDPPLLPAASERLEFKQELLLSRGQMRVTVGERPGGVELLLFVVPGQPLIIVEGRFGELRSVRCVLEDWRTQDRVLEAPPELQSAWAMRDAPADVPRELLTESADTIVSRADAVAWYHHNATSIVPFTIRRQGLADVATLVPDPILYRTFGGLMTGIEMKATSPTSLASTEPRHRFRVGISVPCVQSERIEDWLAQAEAVRPSRIMNDASHAEQTIEDWQGLWHRSWIIASADSSPAREECELITRAYALQRYMLACASRGDFPIKFNGSIFTVEPEFVEGQPFNADWRKWGGSYWWQNTRLPYYPMLAAGDFDRMNSLFSFYERCLPACRARAKLYYGAQGAYFPETMTTFATYANGDYGWNRDGLDRSDISPCPWWQFTWQQGLELSQMMLDFAAYTGDEEFLRERAVPMANESLRYYDSRFNRDDRGVLIISPTQVVETYWKGVVNDAPSVAGLHTVCDMLLALPESAGDPEDRALWTRMKAAAPALPVLAEGGVTMCAPAEKYDPARSNCETGELYALFPFRLYGVGRPNIDHALEAYRRRADKATHGWTQDGMFAAMLGLTGEAQANLMAKCRNSNKNFRFPAMWGPNFDWLPDQCHGGNLMTTTQLMLMQCYDDKIHLLPAWPREWNVSFRLHAPKQTEVECVYRDGKVQSLIVLPESRRADVVMPPP